MSMSGKRAIGHSAETRLAIAYSALREAERASREARNNFSRCQDEVYFIEKEIREATS